MAEKLSLPETTILLILMAEAQEISNPELKERYGLTLDGKSRLKLNDLKFVDSRKVGRGFVHSLTDQGWVRCAAELSVTSPPARSGSAGAALYALLAGLGRYIERSNLSLAEVFGEVGGSPRQSDAPQLDLESRIRKAYRESAREPGGWVSLTELRSLLGGVAKADVDAALRQMNQLPDVNIVPESNQKTLTQADRDAAVRLGGQEKHLISIEGT
jgi:hypothetical protein